MDFSSDLIKIMHTEQDTQGIFSTKVEIKGYNVVIYGQNVFDQPVKIDLKTYDKIRK